MFKQPVNQLTKRFKNLMTKNFMTEDCPCHFGQLIIQVAEVRLSRKSNLKTNHNLYIGALTGLHKKTFIGNV